MRPIDEIDGEPAEVLAKLAAGPYHGGESGAHRAEVLAGWLERGEVDRGEVETAHMLAHLELVDGEDDSGRYNWAQALVVLARVLRLGGVGPA